MDKVFSFVRHNEDEKVFVIINFSREKVDVMFAEPLFESEYAHWDSGEHITFNADSSTKLGPWEFQIWVA
jgi:hypothetical protein